MNWVDYLLDADELAPVIKVLQEALITRPNPEGEPHFDLQTALDSCDEYFESVRELTEAAGKLWWTPMSRPRERQGLLRSDRHGTRVDEVHSLWSPVAQR